MKVVSKTDNYQTGDCFDFREKIRDFGLVFIKENMYHDDRQLNFFPVKLDTAREGMDRFKYGKAYLTSFRDFTNTEGKTEGFMVYFFLDQNDFKFINTLFAYAGNISIKEKYKNSTGGTSASNYDDFRFQLNRWEQMFRGNGSLVAVADILK